MQGVALRSVCTSTLKLDADAVVSGVGKPDAELPVAPVRVNPGVDPVSESASPVQAVHLRQLPSFGSLCLLELLVQILHETLFALSVAVHLRAGGIERGIMASTCPAFLHLNAVEQARDIGFRRVSKLDVVVRHEGSATLDKRDRNLERTVVHPDAWGYRGTQSGAKGDSCAIVTSACPATSALIPGESISWIPGCRRPRGGRRKRSVP